MAPEAGESRVGHPPGGGVGLVREVPVEGRGDPLPREASPELREDPVPHKRDGGGVAGERRVGGVEGEVVAVDGAVRRVAVHEEVRLPLREQARHVPRLHGVLFDGVAVEVPAPAGVAGADPPRGADLALEVHHVEPAVEGRDAIVAVGVEVGDEDEGEPAQHSGLLHREPPLPRQGEERLLALDLAGVDVRLDHHHGPPLPPRRGGREGGARGEDEDRHVPALPRRPHGQEAHAAAPPGQGGAEHLHLGVAGGLRVPAVLGPGEELRVLDARRLRHGHLPGMRRTGPRGRSGFSPRAMRSSRILSSKAW